MAVITNWSETELVMLADKIVSQEAGVLQDHWNKRAAQALQDFSAFLHSKRKVMQAPKGEIASAAKLNVDDRIVVVGTKFNGLEGTIIGDRDDPRWLGFYVVVLDKMGDAHIPFNGETLRRCGNERNP
jgi:hypothetical protein